MRRFEGKVALVTGGSSGIGRAAAMAFAREGAAVMIAARGAERGEAVVREIKAEGGTAAFFAADVSQSAAVEALVRATVERFGRLDCAMNNAATLEIGAHKPLADLTDEEFGAQIAFNLTSVFLCMRAEIRQMLAQGGGGAIVNTSSVNGLGGVPGASPYAAAKAGVHGLTKSAALEYAAGGIRVNALVAGGFQTPMLEGVFRHMAGGNPETEQAIVAQTKQMIPLARIGRPEEAADAALWLCSDQSSYVTGSSLIVDGGISATFR